MTHSANLRRIADANFDNPQLLGERALTTLYQIAAELEWVKCSERLPEPLRCVLCQSEDGLLLAWWSQVNLCWVSHFTGEDIEQGSLDKPTHWLPLPPPPAD